MAFTFRSYEQATAGYGTSITVSVPLNTTTNDLMVAVIAKDDDPAITPPAGWFELVSYGTTTGVQDLRTWIGYRIGTASEPASYTWTGDSEEWAGVISTYIPSNANAYNGSVSVSVRRSGTDDTPVNSRQ